jgi:ubiquitin-like protein Nedd8
MLFCRIHIADVESTWGHVESTLRIKNVRVKRGSDKKKLPADLELDEIPNGKEKNQKGREKKHARAHEEMSGRDKRKRGKTKYGDKALARALASMKKARTERERTALVRTIEEGLDAEKEERRRLEKKIADVSGELHAVKSAPDPPIVIDHSPFKITLQCTNNDRRIDVTAGHYDTILNLKEEINFREGLPIGSTIMEFDGKTLDDKLAIGSYGISAGSIVRFRLRDHGEASIQSSVEPLFPHPDSLPPLFPDPGLYSIRVNEIPSGLEYRIAVDREDTIRMFKEFISDKRGIPPVQIRLIYGGAILDDDKTLASYGIRSEMIVYLTLALRGAKPVIYVYNAPDAENKISVSLSSNWTISCAYPEPTTRHERGSEISWTFRPDRTGGGVYRTDGFSWEPPFPYLFWDAVTTPGSKNQPFVSWFSREVSEKLCATIASDKAAAFMEKCLDHLGLNRKEATDFITHWMPSWKNGSKVCFAFLTDKQYHTVAQLNASPTPFAKIRVFMLFRVLREDECPAIDKDPVNMTDFLGPRRDRDKYVDKHHIVEWGGMEMK